jgi:hypothetical protein
VFQVTLLAAALELSKIQVAEVVQQVLAELAAAEMVDTKELELQELLALAAVVVLVEVAQQAVLV